MHLTDTHREKILLVGCALKTSPKSLASGQDALSLDESLDELASLSVSAGGQVVSRMIQEREQFDPAYLIGSGKLQELEESLREHNVDLVVFDENLSPAQQRNIERKIGCRVIDRTQLILDIFAHRARTREGKLQVELAQLSYLLPRLAGRGVELSRLGGGIGTRGPGETKLETDQRRIRKRIHKIEEELEKVRCHRSLHRAFRTSVPVPTVSLVGYTNAGKSTLFNALTQAGTLASDQLFATLDPLLRRIRLPSNREVLLSDTVGFIHKLPTTLVSAFRATLEEIGQADLLLHVIDISSPHCRQQREAVLRILEELKVSSKPILEVHNKIDLMVTSPHVFSESSKQVTISAARGTGIDTLLARIDECLCRDPLIKAKFLFSQKNGNLLSKLYSCSRLIQRTYVDDHVYVEVEAPQSVVDRLKEFRIEA
jgi:GTP-binding protein HflX